MSHLRLPEAIEHEQLRLPIAEEIHNPHYHEYLKLTQKQWMFSDLLMMNKEETILTSNKQKIKILNLLYHCYRSAAEALQAFYIERKPELFDAHVGESACQIRAIKLAMMLKEINIKISTEALVKSQAYQKEANRIHDLLQQYKTPHNQIESKICLQDFYSKYALDAHIDKDYVFLIISYILCMLRKKIAIDTDILDYIFLMKEWGLTRKQAVKYSCHLQKLCSFFSAELVFSTGDNCLFFMAAYQLQKDYLGRWVLPTLTSVEWMLSFIKGLQLKFIFRVWMEESKAHYSMFSDYTYDGKLFDSTNVALPSRFKNPVIYINAFTNNMQHSIGSLRRKLSNLGFEHILSANAASHPQYTCQSLNAYNNNPYDILSSYICTTEIEQRQRGLRNLQACAAMNGLCKSNPNTLAIMHISCGLL